MKPINIFFLFATIVLSANTAWSADTRALTNVLKQVDQLVCTDPQKMTNYYASDMIIITDDKRVLPENRIKNYQAMIDQLHGMKCMNKRTVLSGQVGGTTGFLLVDELISVSSQSSTDERQHSVCTYTFTKKGNAWKIQHEHCSSLPDYTIVPGDDALYYFHNPVY